jgi:hypothetical protein
MKETKGKGFHVHARPHEVVKRFDAMDVGRKQYNRYKVMVGNVHQRVK